MNKQFTSKTKILISALAVLGAGNLMAEETLAGITATVSVENTFTFTQQTDLDFGQIAANAATDGVDVSTLLLPANPNESVTVTSGTGDVSFINMMTDATSGAFIIEGAAPNTNLTIDFPGEIQLTETTGATTTQFTVDDWTAYMTSGNNLDTDYDAGTPNLTTGGDGKVAFNLGATLSTDIRTAAENLGTYENGSYSGTFDLTVHY